MSGKPAETGPIDQRLRVLDACADREWFGFDMHAAPVQHGESVPRAVADREHDMRRFDLRAIGQDQAAKLAGSVGGDVDGDILDPAAEAVFAAQRLDLLPDALDHGDQAEGADMRLADEQDFLGCAGLRRTRSAPCGRGGEDP